MNDLLKIIDTNSMSLSRKEMENIEKYKNASKGSFSENTERARKNDMAIFESWCDKNNFISLPASESTVVDFVDAQAEIKKVATIKRYLWAITTAHKVAQLKNPVKNEFVRLAVRRISRKYGTRQKQATGLNWPQINQALQALDDSPRSRLDKALVCISYDTLCRRSETINIHFEDIEFSDDGSAVVLIKKSKTDQTREGAMKYLSHTSVEYLKEWLEFSKITEGFIFRGVSRWGHVLEKPLSGEGVSRSFKRVTQKTGLNTDGISGHSTRVGACQDLVSAGIDMPAIMQAGSWKNPERIALYSEKLQAKRGGMAQLSAIQRR